MYIFKYVILYIMYPTPEEGVGYIRVGVAGSCESLLWVLG